MTSWNNKRKRSIKFTRTQAFLELAVFFIINEHKILKSDPSDLLYECDKNISSSIPSRRKREKKSFID